MIYYDDENLVFHLQTKTTSYIMNILPSKHLGTLYYGSILDINNGIEGLELKHKIQVGGQVNYEKEDDT